MWDVGNVLIDWDPRYMYRTVIADENAMEDFLRDVCHYEWNLEQDKGRAWVDAIALKTAEFPHHAEWIRAYSERWRDMVSGPIAGSVEILQAMKNANIPLYAITNFSHEKWPVAQDAFPFLKLFDGVTVSGEVKMLKPDPEIYRHFLTSFSLNAGDLLFIDDREENIEAARVEGFHGIVFENAEKLRHSLKSFGIIL